jgi:hypothetical protein
MIFARIGKHWLDSEPAGAGVGAIFLGHFGAGIGAAMGDVIQKSQSTKKDRLIGELIGLSADDLLKLDRSNFLIYYSDIIRAEVRGPGQSLRKRAGVLLMEGIKNYRFDIVSDRDNRQVCSRLIETTLPGKIVRH